MKMLRNNRGDTIVEVIIVTAILALVLAGSYSLTSHGLQDGIDANRRTEALSIAQRQIEYIKDAYNHQTGFLDDYQNAASDFCVDTNTPSGLLPIYYTQPGSVCKNYRNSGVSISVHYDTAKQIFTATSTWDATGGHKGVTQLYYQTAS